MMPTAVRFGENSDNEVIVLIYNDLCNVTIQTKHILKLLQLLDI